MAHSEGRTQSENELSSHAFPVTHSFLRIMCAAGEACTKGTICSTFTSKPRLSSSDLNRAGDSKHCNNTTELRKLYEEVCDTISLNFVQLPASSKGSSLSFYQQCDCLYLLMGRKKEIQLITTRSHTCSSHYLNQALVRIAFFFSACKLEEGLKKCPAQLCLTANFWSHSGS